MAGSFLVVGDSVVAGCSKGETIDEQVLVGWPANIPALIEGGHIEDVAGGDPVPADPAPASAGVSQEG